MSTWEEYPQNYRSEEIATLLAALRRGECAALIGLSGAGKSNLLGFMAQRTANQPALALVDCNRLAHPDPSDLFQLLLRSVNRLPGADPQTNLEEAIQAHLAAQSGLTLLFDRFDALPDELHGCLRSLRDDFKYKLTLLIAARKQPKPSSELAELFFAHTLWLGPLSVSDARWSAGQYASRNELDWNPEMLDRLAEITWGYPGFLRAACEAAAAGCPIDVEALRAHPAVQARVREFLADAPGPQDLRLSRLEGHPFLIVTGEPDSPLKRIDRSTLTAKEALLLEYLEGHALLVCDKDDLIRAVWPEDQVFTEGIRDDSLAQLVRRLRRKVEPDPGNPRFILNVTGRGYRFVK